MSSAEPHSGDKLRRYSFGGFTLDLERGFLRNGCEEISLRPKSFEVLAYLVERQGRLVSREELMRAVWPDVAVTDESVTKCIADIRKALADDSQQLVRTQARRGYVFAASVTTPIVQFPRQIGGETEYGLTAPLMIHGAPQPRPNDLPTALRAVTEGQISQSAKGDRREHILVNWVWPAALAALLITAGTAFMVFRAAHPGRGNGPVALEYTQLTNFTDSGFALALSPDGRMLAFIRGENIGTLGGEGDIYIKLLPDGEPVQLTHDGKNKMSPVFNPGGDRIAYGVPGVMTDPMSWSTWTVSVFGGEPKLLLANASALSWIAGASPPRVLFSEVDTGSHMAIVTSAENRTEGRTVYSPAAWNAMAHRSFLSPDRKQVLVVEMGGGGWRRWTDAPRRPPCQP